MQSEVIVEKRYRVLRVIATLFRVLGIIGGVLVVLAAIGICLTLVLGASVITPWETPRPWWGRPSILPGIFLLVRSALGSVSLALVLVVSAIQALVLYSIGELIHLFLALEENTRAIAAALRQPRT